jgi:putative flippase GtrA
MRRAGWFALAGGTGFAVDFVVLAVALASGLGPFAGRAPSFAAAVMATYLINANLTFEASDRIGVRSLAAYVATSAGGLAVNIAVYAALVSAGLAPLGALAIASLCALGFNYAGYSRLFGSRR